MGERAGVEKGDGMAALAKFEGRGDAVNAGAEDDDGGHKLALGIFGGGEEDENGEVFGDGEEFMGLVGGDVEDGAGTNGLGFVFELELGLAGKEVVDFVFGVGLLGVGAASRETVEAHAEGGDVEEFEVVVIVPVMPGKEFFEVVGVHRMI